MTLIGGGIQGEAVRYAGQDLKALGVYCELADGIVSGPPVRGQNLLIPYSHGQRWAKKYYDERHVVLNGTMLSTVSRADFFSKLDTLKQLFAIDSGEQLLEVQRQDGTFRQVMAEVRNTLGLQYQLFPTRSATFSIELVASDPFWYGQANLGGLGTAWTLDSGVSLDDGAHWLDGGLVGALFAQTLTQQQTVVIAHQSGTGPQRRPVFALTGILVNPKITNVENGYSIQVLVDTAEVARKLVIDCGLQLATLDGSAISPALIVLGPAGQTDWLRLEAGDNRLLVDAGVLHSATLDGVTSTVPAYSIAYTATFPAAYL